MMFDILIYGSAVALLFSVAGLAIEQITAWRGWPRRGIWTVTLIASLVLPATMVTRPHSQTAVQSSLRTSLPAAQIPASARSEPIVATTSAAMTPIAIPVIDRYSLPSFDKICRALWLAMSAGLLATFALSWARIRRARRHWRRATVDGYELWVTRALGPAVLGFLKPKVLIPQWMLDCPAATRSMVLIHESEHIAARDPLLLLMGLLVVLLLPWNLLLWWQLRRLRFAVEVDCDARVLRRVTDVQTYAKVLLAVNQRGALAPFGAMAIAARVSQLERRVRIMTSLRRRASRWLIGAAVSLCIACVAIAVNLNAPTLSDSELRKPPLHDWSPFLPKAEAAARAAYPELFQGRFSGSVVLAVDLNRDGEVLDIRELGLPVGPVADDAIELDAEWMSESSDVYFARGARGQKFVGGFGPDRTNRLYVDYRVLKWPHDPARSAARVRAAVAAQYPEFFRAYAPSESSQEGKHKLLTVFMNDDGTINRAKLSDDDGHTIGSEKAEFNQFVDLGLTPEQFAHRAHTSNFHDSRPWYRYPDEPSLMICYAWPRRPADPPDEAFQSHAVFTQAFDKWMREGEEQVPDEAFLKHYFPDAWEHGPANASENLWILLDRQGKVWDTGRSRYSGRSGDFPVLAKELEAQYPGTRISLERSRDAETASGRPVYLEFFRLDDDSPVTDRARIDYSKQRDLFLVVDECRNGTECGPVPYLMNFGAPVASWIGGLHVQLIAADAGSGFVDLQLRTQTIDGSAQSLLSNWSAAGNPVHIADGGEASVELVDQRGMRWRIVLKPRRLKRLTGPRSVSD
jgi:beta-lactamase regulating signal transducer with metallopeptidase domain